MSIAATETPQATEATEAADDIDPETLDLADDVPDPEPEDEPAQKAEKAEEGEESDTEPDAKAEGEGEGEGKKEPEVKADEKADEKVDDKIDLDKIRQERQPLVEKLEAERKAREVELELKAAKESAAKYAELEQLANSDPLALLDRLKVDTDDLVQRMLDRAEGKTSPEPQRDGETARERELREENERLRAEQDKVNQDAQKRQQTQAYDMAVAEATRVMGKEGDRFKALTAAEVTPAQVYDEFARYVRDNRLQDEVKNEGRAVQYLLAIADEMNAAEVRRTERVAKELGFTAKESKATPGAAKGSKPAVSSKMAKGGVPEEQEGPTNLADWEEWWRNHDPDLDVV